MSDYRLSVAQSVPATRRLSDTLGAPFEEKITPQTVHAFADAFLRITGKARDEGVVSDIEIAELRAEISTRLRPRKVVRYLKNERAVLFALGGCTEPTPSAKIAELTGLPRPIVNAALYSLRQKEAVRGAPSHQKGKNRTYELTEKAAEFRNTPADRAPQEQ